jgi:hypothetical protein
MRERTNRSFSAWVGLLSLAIAACSGAAEDGLVTVGIRPTGGVAAAGSTGASGAGGLPMPGSNVMNQIPDADSTTVPRVSTGGASGASVAISTSPGSRTPVPPRGGATASPGAAIAGAGGMGIAAAGAGGSLAANEDECGAIPSSPSGKVTSGRVIGSGLVEYDVDASNAFIGLRTTLAVPAEPAPNGQVFIWPGIQPTPNAMNLQPISNGALLPVLTWGPSCAPDAPASYSTWWIAPMYSNVSSSDPDYFGCHAGKVTLAKPKQLLDIDIHLEGTKWVQKVINRDTLAASDFSMDLEGQTQGRVFFDIELQTSNKPTEDIVFTNTVLAMDVSDPDACQPVMRGMNDFASKPRVSSDGKRCCIDRIVLRAPRVMATTVDPP